MSQRISEKISIDEIKHREMEQNEYDDYLYYSGNTQSFMDFR